MLGCIRRTHMQSNAHDDKIKCNTQANDMATTTNKRKTPGASNLGCYINIAFMIFMFMVDYILLMLVLGVN